MSFNPREYYKKYVLNEYTLNVITSVCQYPMDNDTICPEKSLDFSGICTNHSGQIIQEDQMKHVHYMTISKYLKDIVNVYGKLNKLQIVSTIYSFQLLHPYILISNEEYFSTNISKLNELKTDEFVENHLHIFNPHNFYSWIVAGGKLDYTNPKYNQNIPDNIDIYEVEIHGDLIYINRKKCDYTLIL